LQFRVTGLDLVEKDGGFEVGQGGADAEVRPESKGENASLLAADIEVIWIGENGRIAIGRAKSQ
jgi:hypothetical protein